MSTQPAPENPDVSITIAMEADCLLAAHEIWPDGDAPEEITAAAVAALMRESGSKRRVLDDWCLLEDLSVRVYVDAPNPHWRLGPPLPGFEQVERWKRTSADVWDHWGAS